MAVMKVETSGIPAGIYDAKFLGVEASTHEEYGPRLSWQFEVTGGDHTGAKTSRFTGAAPRPKTACFEMLCGIAGRKLEVDETFDPDVAIGAAYQVVVKDTQSGNSTRVEQCILRKSGDAVPF